MIQITLIISFCLGSSEFNDDYPKKASFGIVAAEFGGGFVGAFGGAAVGGLIIYSGIALFSKSQNLGDFIFIYPVAAIGGLFGCAGGTCLVGSANHQGGKFLPTLAGATLGAVAGGSSFLINPLFGIASIVLLTPLGAVIGYNMSRESIGGYSKGPLWNRFDLPAFSFRTEMTKEYKITQVYDFRLVNVRF